MHSIYPICQCFPTFSEHHSYSKTYIDKTFFALSSNIFLPRFPGWNFFTDEALGQPTNPRQTDLKKKKKLKPHSPNPLYVSGEWRGRGRFFLPSKFLWRNYIKVFLTHTFLTSLLFFIYLPRLKKPVRMYFFSTQTYTFPFCAQSQRPDFNIWNSSLWKKEVCYSLTFLHYALHCVLIRNIISPLGNCNSAKIHMEDKKVVSNDTRVPS